MRGERRAEIAEGRSSRPYMYSETPPEKLITSACAAAQGSSRSRAAGRRRERAC